MKGLRIQGPLLAVTDGEGPLTFLAQIGRAHAMPRWLSD